MENNKLLQYQWLGSISAPAAYPVEIYRGALRAQDYAYTFDPIWGIIASGWGEQGGIMTNDSPASELPQELSMTWYAIKEKTFYTGKWTLDRDEIAKLWEAGYQNVLNGNKENYTSFLIGLAPKGNVVLWAYGTDRQVELARFQARDTVITKEGASEDFQYFFRPSYQEKMYADTALFAADLLASLQSKGWPDPNLYTQYTQKYDWGLSVSGMGTQPVDYFYYQNFDGERERLPADSANRSVSRAIPKHIYAVWKDAGGKEWVADAKFDFEQVSPAYAQLEKQQPFTIALVVDATAKKVEVMLQQGNKKITLPTTERTLVTD